MDKLMPKKRARIKSPEGHAANNFPKRANCLSEIFTDTSIPCLTRIAENTSMPATMLDQLALHTNPVVREAVADNMNTPIDTLWVLSCDECVDVRYAIAENHNVPLAILAALSEDENPYVACRARSTMDRLMGGYLIEPTCWSIDADDHAVGY